MPSAQKIGRYTPGLNRGHLSPSPDHNTGSTSVRESVKIRASQSDAAYEETVEKHGRRQKVFLCLSLSFTILTMLSSEMFWFFPMLEEKTNKTVSHYVRHSARWTEWKIFIAVELVIIVASSGALFATRNIRNLEAHIVVVLMGLLTFCFLLSTSNTVVFASIWMNHERNGQKLPIFGGKSLEKICEEDGIGAGGLWWSDYYNGIIPSSSLNTQEYEMMRMLKDPDVPGRIASWLTLTCNTIASLFFLCSCQMGFFALP